MNMSLLTCAAGCAVLTALVHPDDDSKNKHDDGRGDEVSRSYDLKDFDRIDISGVYELEVTVGEKFSIELVGYERDLERADIRLKRDVLILAHEGRDGWNKRKGHHQSVEARITLPDLKGINVSGVVDGSVKGVKAERFEVKVSGVGDMDFYGTCKTLDADISGVGDVEAEGLRCKHVDVTVSGVGDASVYASQSVEASVSGMGDIDVFGSPEKVSENSGRFSEVKIR